MKTINTIALLLSILIILFLVAVIPEGDAAPGGDKYCSMVQLWNENKHLSPSDRPGWPPFNGECSEKEIKNLPYDESKNTTFEVIR